MPEQASFLEYDSLKEENVIDWYTDGVREEEWQVMEIQKSLI